MTGARRGKGKSILIGLVIAGVLGGGIYGAVSLAGGDKTPATHRPDGTEPPAIVETVEPEYVYSKYFMGDLRDEKAVQERAAQILEIFNQNGIVHSENGALYTQEEIEIIIQYINGGILPNGMDPDAANTAFLNMICDIGNTNLVLYNSAYMTGSQIIRTNAAGDLIDFRGNPVDINHTGFDETTGMTIISPEYAHLYCPEGFGTPEQNFKAAADCYVPIDFTLFMFGDSSVHPYLVWFNNQYTTLMTSTDRQQKVQIFNEMTQSLANFTYGAGHKFETEDGIITVTFNDFADYDDVNDSNTLRIMVALYQTARSVIFSPDNPIHTQEIYKIHNFSGVADVHIDSILPQFNAVCAEDDVQFYDGVGNPVIGDNIDARTYANTTDGIAENMENGDLDHWADHYVPRKTK